MSGNDLPKGWVKVHVIDVIHKISTNKKKIKQKNYTKNGRIPVIDQGQELISGYTNNTRSIINTPLPLIVFGDHTRILKFVNFEFAPGADGIKIIKPLSCYNEKLFYYFSKVIQLPNKGYARHFQFFEKSEIKLPPLNEQHRIVEIIEEKFTVADKAVEIIERSLKQADKLRQSILKRAFEGKLVPQDPNDEPADKLLERIKAEKARLEKEMKSKKKSNRIRKVKVSKEA